ncbi:MAG: sugar ABC transporter substrate-binding protein [Clostridia bacterium]|nr:sugar ABC transporter substrate-binding protein [Clostridia bacterium]
MKKIIAMLLVMLMAVSAVACAAPAAAPAPAPAPAAEAPAAEAPAANDTLVGVAMPTQSLQRWNQDGSNMKAQLEAKGYQVDLQYAENDNATQISQIENMILKGCKVLVIASIDGSTLSNVLQTAADNGVKVIAYDRLIMDTQNVDYYATFDNYMVGTIQGNYIVDALDLANTDKTFNFEVFGGSPDDNNAYFFYNGAMDVLTPYVESGKLINNSGKIGMDVVGILGWGSADAQAEMDNRLSAYYTDKNVDVVLSPNDSLAFGIVSSLEAQGYGTADKPFPVITGQDCDMANVKNMIAGKQSMSVFKDTRTLAEKVVGMVDAIMQGTEPEVNDTETYNNNVKNVPTYLCEPVFADVNNYKALLIDSGYYTEADLA